MAHSVEIPYLDKENIEIYLNDLATEIEKAKIGKHSILIVGGAYFFLGFLFPDAHVRLPGKD